MTFRLIAWSLALVVALGASLVSGTGSLVDVAVAQDVSSFPPNGEEAALNLATRKTWIKTEDTGIGFTNPGTNAFTDTVVNCPGAVGTTCVIRVEVSSQFGNVGSSLEDRARILVSIDGSGAGIFPNDTVTVENGPVNNVRALTFSFMKPGVNPGNHTVRVRFATGANFAQGAAFFRILTITVYKP